MPEKPLAAPEQATPSMSLREFKLKPPRTYYRSYSS